MLRIVEISSEEKFTEARANEDYKFDYLYILKYCNQIKVSDNGTLKNYTNIQVCESLDDYNNISEKSNILYIVKNNNLYSLYIADVLIIDTVLNENLDDIVKEIVNAVDGTGDDTE